MTLKSAGSGRNKPEPLFFARWQTIFGQIDEKGREKGWKNGRWQRKLTFFDSVISH